MRKNYLIIIILAITICQTGFADEKKVTAAKGIDETASDIVTSVFNKTNALVQGNLNVTMSPDNTREKNKNNYTLNALGMRVPRSTNVRN